MTWTFLNNKMPITYGNWHLQRQKMQRVVSRMLCPSPGDKPRLTVNPSETSLIRTVTYGVKTPNSYVAQKLVAPDGR